MKFLPRGLVLLLALGVSRAGAVDYYQTEFPGTPPITARWAFEPWVWEDNTFTTAAIEGLVDGYKSRNIPVGGTIIDSPWCTSYMNFQFDTARYPDPAGMISHLRSENVRVMLWMVGEINDSTISDGTPIPHNPDLENIVRPQQYRVKLPGTQTDVFDWWRGRGAHIDFSNPAAVNWFMGQASPLMAMGISGFKLDGSEQWVPDPVHTSNGSSLNPTPGIPTDVPKDQLATYYYAKVSDWTRANVPNNEGVVFGRAWDPDTYGNKYISPISKMTTTNCGDAAGGFAGFQSQANHVLAAAAAGYGAVGFEIGGYSGANPTHDSLLRQAEFAALLPVMENGGQNGGEAEHLPWYWDAHGYTGTTNTYRYYATLHHNLVPFLFSKSVEQNLTGSLMLTQTDTTALRHVLGGAILTQAVTAAGTQTVTVNFPSGGSTPWINWWNHAQTFNPGGSSTAAYTVDKSPIFVRAGSIIPMNVENNVTGLGDDNSAGKLSVVVFPYGNSALSFHRALGDGTAYEDVNFTSNAGANGGTIAVAGPTSVAYRFVISSLTAPPSVTGVDSWFYDATNKWIIADKTGASFSFVYGTVPEPATLALLAAAAAAFGLWRLRAARRETTT